MNTVSRPFASASRRLLSVAAFAAALPLVPCAFAQSVWDGGADANWSNAVNWSGDTAPVPGATTDVTFAGTTGLANTNDFAANSVFRNIAFSSGAGAFTLGGNTLNWVGTIVNSSSSIQTINANLRISSISGDRTISPGTGGTVIFNGVIDYNGYRLFPNTTVGTIVLNGANTGLGNASNPFSTGITTTIRNNVAGTTLVLGNKSALGAAGAQNGVQVNANMTLQSNTDLSGANAVNNAFVIGGAAKLAISGSNNLEISGNVYNAGGNRDIEVSNTAATTLSGNVFLSNDTTGRQLAFNVAGTAGTTRVGGVISNNNNLVGGGAGTVLKIGAGTLILSGANTYTGPTNVSAGTLVLDGATHASPANTTVSSGATLRIASSVSQGTGANAGRILINNGGFLTGDGTLILSDTNGGTTGLSVSGNFSAGNSGIGTFTVNAANSVRSAVSFEGTGTMTFELGAGFASDRLALVGGAANDIFFNNNVISFTDLTAGSLSTGAYTLFSSDVAGAYSGITVDGNGFVTGGLTISSTFLTDNTAYTAANLQLVGNNLVLNLTGAAIPEPSTAAALAGLGVLGLAVSRRRRSP